MLAEAVICYKNNLLCLVEMPEETKMHCIRFVVLRSFVYKLFSELSKNLIYITFNIWLTSSCKHRFLFFCFAVKNFRFHQSLFVVLAKVLFAKSMCKQISSYFIFTNFSRCFGVLLLSVCTVICDRASENAMLHYLTDHRVCRWSWDDYCCLIYHHYGAPRMYLILRNVFFCLFN